MYMLTGSIGITPAGAGKTNQQFRQRNRTEDHPRRCGENVRAAENFDFSAGSPPQVRGKPRVSVARGAEPGITPAGAGKTVNVGQLQFIN